MFYKTYLGYIKTKYTVLKKKSLILVNGEFGSGFKKQAKTMKSRVKFYKQKQFRTTEKWFKASGSSTGSTTC